MTHTTPTTHMTDTTPDRRRQLQATVTCPHCWTSFPSADVRFIAESPTLMGDAVLGSDDALRFLPSRFDRRARAIDPSGAQCTRMACPTCHLEVPAALLEVGQTVVSVVGAPGSGKSVMLAAATFTLRSGQVVPGLDFVDIDPALNDLSIGLESTLFRSTTPNEPAMIEKTESAGRLYRTYRRGDQRFSAPKPQLFGINRGGTRSVLALYDNAGEHFLPGAIAPFEQATRHLGVSSALVLVLDPTQDPRVHGPLGGRAHVASLGGSSESDGRSDLVLLEMVNRVRRQRGLSTVEPLPMRVVIALSKHDLWAPLAPELEDAVRAQASDSPMLAPRGDALAKIHRGCVQFLERHLPEVVGAVRSVEPGFKVAPFSGLGRAPSRVEGSGAMGIRPEHVRPTWAAVPFVIAASEALPLAFSEYAFDARA